MTLLPVSLGDCVNVQLVYLGHSVTSEVDNVSEHKKQKHALSNKTQMLH